MNPLVQYWYFHLPNFVLAAVMYTLIGRLLLSFFAPTDWKNYIWTAFLRITNPAVRAVRAVTPEVVPEPVLLIFAVLWLMLARIGLLLVFGNLGLLPRLG
jgi:uncharacterized protein YggT (Ycf19 family)